MADLDPDQVVAATADPVHAIGSAIYLSPETLGRATEWGWANPFAFYFAGRGAAMGDVDGPVAVAAMGWFNPELAVPMFEEGVAVHGAAKAVERMFEATALWGRDHLAGLDLDGLVEVADRFVEAADPSGLPLFAGWRAQPRADDVPGRAAQLLQILREWRGAVHVVATTAAGLAPVEAILTDAGPGQARFFGWSEPFPDVTHLADRRKEADATTDRLCAVQFERLTPAERGAFVAGVEAALTALP